MYTPISDTTASDTDIVKPEKSENRNFVDNVTLSPELTSSSLSVTTTAGVSTFEIINWIELVELAKNSDR